MKLKLSLIISGLLVAFACSAQQSFTNVIKFFIEPELATNLNGISLNLAKYVDDMNYILAKNTQHQLKYDPSNGLFVQSFPPFNGMIFNNAPTSNYEIRVWIRYSDLGYSWGEGGFSADISGAAGITALHWHGFFNPHNLPYVEDFWDYRLQLSALLHGYGQIYGVAVAVGDIYANMSSIADNTGVAPQSDIQMMLPGFVWNYADVYWGLNSDYYGDLGIGQFETTNRLHFLLLHGFSGLHSTIIRKNYRFLTAANPPFAATNAIYTKLTDVVTCAPQDGVRVRIWRVNNSLPTALLVDQTTGTNGTIVWSWQSAFNNHSEDSVRMIKCTRTGYPTVVKVLTTLDLQAAAVFNGYSHLTNEIYMVRPKLKLLIRASDKRVTVTNLVPGKAFALQGMTDLNAGWTTITNVNPTSTANFNYNHPAGAPPIRFYRTEEQAECPIPLQMVMAPSEVESAEPVQRKRGTFVRKDIPLPPLPPHPSQFKFKSR